MSVYAETSTKILSLPFVTIIFQTGTNEDWIDSLLFLVPDGSNNVANYPQLDLRGITFNMEVRPSVEDAQVVLAASTTDGTLSIGDYPNYGWLIWDIPEETTMQYIFPGDYVADLVASDGTFTRRIADIAITIVEGVTR